MKRLLPIILCLIIAFSTAAQEVVPVIQSGHSGSIIYVEWDNNGRYIASVDDNNEIIIYDIIAGKVFYRTKFPGTKLIAGIQFDNEGRLYASNSDKAICFDPATLQTTEVERGVPAKKMSSNFKIRNSSLKRTSRGILFNRNAYTKFTFAAESPDIVANPKQEAHSTFGEGEATNNMNDNLKTKYTRANPSIKYVVAGDETGGIYFCTQKMEIKAYRKEHNLPINDISFSRDGNLVAVASADRSVSIWRLKDFNIERRFIPRSFNISALAPSSDNNSFAFGDELGYAYKITFAHDKLLCEAVNAHDGQINSIQLAANNNVAVTGSSDNNAAVVDFENKSVLAKIKALNGSKNIKKVFDINAIQEQALKGNDDKNNMYDDNVYSVAISKDGNKIALSSGKWGLDDPIIKHANISSLNVLGTKEERATKSKTKPLAIAVPNNTHIYKQLIFDSLGNFYGFEDTRKIYKYKSTITGYAVDKECEMGEILDNTPNSLLLRISQEPSMTDVYLQKIDPSNGDIYKCKGFEITRQNKNGQTVTYKGQYGFINDFIILKGKQYLISSAKDASLNIYDLESGEKMLSVYVVDGGKLIYVTPDYYYMATGEAITGLGYYHNGKIYPAEQFDIKYNRPDYVLNSLGIFDNEIIEMYHLAYLKRIQKLGFTEAMLDGEMELPVVKIINFGEIEVNTGRPTSFVKLNLVDNNHNLNRLNVYVNDVPLYGTKDMDLSDRYSRETFVNVNIPLSAGKNTIQISCVNEKGMESLKEEFEVYYNKDNREKPNLYLISLAVADYAQNEYNLRYTLNDGRGFVQLFSQRASNFGNVIVDSLYNSQCTKANVLALKEKLMNTKVDDYVYIHIAGHGLLDDELNWYFATHDIDFYDPAVNGLRYEEIESLLDGIPARNKLLLMDACHSGEVDKQDGVDIAEKNDGDETRGAKTVNRRKKTKNSLGNSFELMRLLFSDLKKGTGTVVISAASGGGYALEIESIDHGIFTYCLMDAFKKNKADKNKDKLITVSELRSFIFDGVNKLSEGKQQPTSRQENLQNDFMLK